MPENAPFDVNERKVIRETLPYTLNWIEREKRFGWLIKGVGVVGGWVVGLIAFFEAVWPTVQRIFAALAK